MALLGQASSDWTWPTALLQIDCFCLIAYPLRPPSLVWHLFHKKGLLDISPASELISDLNGTNWRLDGGLSHHLPWFSHSEQQVTRHTQRATEWVRPTGCRHHTGQTFFPELLLWWLHMFFFIPQRSGSTSHMEQLLAWPFLLPAFIYDYPFSMVLSPLRLPVSNAPPPGSLLTLGQTESVPGSYLLKVWSWRVTVSLWASVSSHVKFRFLIFIKFRFLSSIPKDSYLAGLGQESGF